MKNLPGLIHLQCISLKLQVWDKAVDLGIEVYKMTRNFPMEEKFGLTSQMRRCSVSIASNIAEGAGRNSNGEFVHFLGIADGSANELETQDVIARRLNYLVEKDFLNVQANIEVIKNMIFRLKQSLS
jgi:four helix bundle protein